VSQCWSGRIAKETTLLSLPGIETQLLDYKARRHTDQTTAAPFVWVKL